LTSAERFRYVIVNGIVVTKDAEPLKLFKPLFLRFSKQSDSNPQARHLRELLDFDPTKYSFGIMDTASSGVEQLRSESGKL